MRPDKDEHSSHCEYQTNARHATNPPNHRTGIGECITAIREVDNAFVSDNELDTEESLQTRKDNLFAESGD